MDESHASTRLDRRGVGGGAIAVVVLLVLVYIGSEGLRWFDAALAPYLFGTLLAVFATVYRYTVWLRRPPTARLNRRGWEALGAKGKLGSNLVALAGMFVTNLALQRFIAPRSRTRWIGHQLLFWGCVLAALVTFPLTFGWVHFESADPSGRTYLAYLGPLATITFDSRSLFGWLVFHLLNIAAVLVIAGVAIFLTRRLHDRGALATERGGDFAALAGLFAVSVTGLMLTASSMWMEGRFYSFLNTLHALTVILGLLYIPFGKLFHILQRPANLGVAFYKQAGAASGPQICVECGDEYASKLQMQDLKEVLPQLGFDYSTEGGLNYQDVCPRCRRRLVGLAQTDRVGGLRLMAGLPVSEEALIERYGPHLNRTPPGGWDAEVEADRVVDTHCCFCGQQCGIRLKVRDEKVVGFEPRYDFPFNEGKLCPKGVKRYLQGSHPDRLLQPLERDPASPTGFRPVTWDQALDRTANEIRRIQGEYGADSFAVLSGVSISNEKSYLMGKFARLGIGTANLDYNGRLCMVSAGAAGKKALGIDRAANPWSDIPLAEVVFVAGANIAECAPITTSYIWRARDRGAKLIVMDPRVTPAARTADVFLGVRPGTDLAVLGAMLHVLIERDWLDHEFIADHTTGFEEAAAAVEAATPAWAAEISGVPVARIEQAAELWGTAATGMLLHARGIEHHTKGVDNVLACINLGLATGKYGKPGCGVNTITGQGNGQGGREHGHKCDQLPGNRDIENPEHREYIASVWECDESEIPGKGLTAQEIMDAIHSGEIKGLLSICFNPLVSLPDANFTREALGKLEHYAVIDFFLSETAAHADVVLPGSLHEEDEGTVTTLEGRVVKINEAIPPPGEARRDWEIICDLAARLGKGHYFEYTSTEEIFDELRRASRGGTADYSGITWQRVVDEQGVFWPCPKEGHPGTPRLYEGGRFYHPDGRARFIPTPWRESSETPDEEYPIYLTTGRVISQYLSGTQTRRIGALVDQYPEPLCEMHPRLAEQLGVADGDTVRLTSRRGSMTAPAKVVSSIRPDTVFVPYHWPGEKSINLLTKRALDPISKIPEFKVSAVRVEKIEGHGEVQDDRDLTLHGERP